MGRHGRHGSCEWEKRKGKHFREAEKEEAEGERQGGRQRKDGCRAYKVCIIYTVHKPKRETPEKGIRYKVKEKKAHGSSQ